ncbi:hypothetical protein SEA_PUPPER_202 [Gordonia phage Pupper]|uniref:Uncharacterized protein n=1 Tax=Gordonia phage Pupper TaxID=2571249 RepID=A0A4Y6EIX7_9CAUD|nr:HNH endonuclease [Gordonia phage Pupper]QDF18688.1 hypothetical protein SEA_PUPPER_202 [Gordonia phage Pupper]QDF18920.1 hypothetical protein SEA_SCENTAE_201 [Gordonia phage SCentae]
MAPGYCCMTAANGEEYPGSGNHDYDCPVGGYGSPDPDYGQNDAGGWGPGGPSSDRYTSTLLRTAGRDYDHDDDFGSMGSETSFRPTYKPRADELPRLRSGDASQLLAQLNWEKPDNWRASMDTWRSAGLTEATMGYLLGVTLARTDVPERDRWRFFCGCCWSVLRG